MPSPRFAFAGLIVALLATQGLVRGQSAVPRAEPMRPGAAGGQSGFFAPTDRMESVDPDTKLGPGDEVTCEIEQDREGGFPKLVSATGEIRVDPYGAIKVAGKTTAEAAAEIKRLLEKDFYYTATVRLSLDRRSRAVVKAGTVTMSGELRGVGPLDLEAGKPMTVSQAILKSGGFGPFANQKKVQVTRSEGGVTKQFFVDVKKVLEKGAKEEDRPVQDGDFINVSRNIFNY